MRVIVGLGNPEKQYKGTRHNTGFEVINKLAGANGISVSKAKFLSRVGEGFLEDERVLLVKPQTFMNNSGNAVRDILGFYKLAPKDVIVIFDDVALPLGDIRIRERGSAGGHNGMKSIIACLGTDEFLRVRVGIGLKPAAITLHDYVLDRFAKEDNEVIERGVTIAGDAVLSILKHGGKHAMNLFNRKTSNEKIPENLPSDKVENNFQ
ncbi:MAG: aminoacyl-tRNA hydrolase [Clostridiales bacterium]|jgi:PTH1 family peptidyl-tRNA hydrolase|nr:aminoacyl-tRNA hydrolase [Clostridiales bacterium]